MKKLQEILELPIISIYDGSEAGKVKDILIDPVKGSVDFFVADTVSHILSKGVIPAGQILGIGGYAMTIENGNAIVDISTIPQAVDLLQKNITVVDTKVMTKKGNLIGEIGDIIIDEDNLCRITGLEFVSDKTEKKAGIIPRECIITFSKNLTIVETDTEQKLLENAAYLLNCKVPGEIYKKDEATAFNSGIDKLQGTAVGNEYSAKSLLKEQTLSEEPYNHYKDNSDEIKPGNAVDNSDEIRPDNNADISDEIKRGNNTDISDEIKPGNAAELFEQRQKQYLTGRKATRRITDNYGRIIVDEDGIITEDVIENAKSKGKMIELVMNNRT